MLTNWFNEDDGRFGDMTSSGFGRTKALGPEWPGHPVHHCPELCGHLLQQVRLAAKHVGSLRCRVVALRRVPKLGLRSVSSLRGRVENAKRNLIDSYWPSIVNGWHDLIMAMQMLRHNHNAHLISVWNCWSVNIQVTDTTKLQNKTIIFLWGFGNLMRDMGLQLFPLRQLLQEWHAADCRHQGAGRDVSLMKYSESLTSGCGWRALDTCRGPELKDCILIILHWRFASADLRFCRLPVSGETRGEEADYCRFGPTRD